MNDNDIRLFTDYCERTFDFDSLGLPNHYRSLPMCILDDVFSLQADYDVVVMRITEWYARDFLNGDRYAQGHTLSQFMANVDASPNAQSFTDEHLGRQNKSCNRLKIELCYELARKLRCLGIETLEDFRDYEYPDVIEIMIRSVKGLKDQAVNYLFMLAGDSSRVKVDTHINKCVSAVFGTTFDNDTTQDLFARAVTILNANHPGLTVSRLDNIIWTYYHNN